MPTIAPIRIPRPTWLAAQPINAPTPMQIAVAVNSTAPAPAGSNLWRGEAACTARGSIPDLVTPENGLNCSEIGGFDPSLSRVAWRRAGCDRDRRRTERARGGEPARGRGDGRARPRGGGR